MELALYFCWSGRLIRKALICPSLDSLFFYNIITAWPVPSKVRISDLFRFCFVLVYLFLAAAQMPYVTASLRKTLSRFSKESCAWVSKTSIYNFPFHYADMPKFFHILCLYLSVWADDTDQGRPNNAPPSSLCSWPAPYLQVQLATVPSCQPITPHSGFYVISYSPATQSKLNIPSV